MLRTTCIVGAAVVLLTGHPSARAETRGFGSLTITDERASGRELALASLEIEAAVEGDLARTTVTHVFSNRLGFDAEGVFHMQLPAGAAVVRLAMDVGGRMMEGELVEANLARATYDEIVARQTDPALLEDKGDGRYDLSIFPIPARGTKTVVLTYEQRLDGRYRFELPRLSPSDRAIGRFRFRLTVDGVVAEHIDRRRFRPRHALERTLAPAASGARIQSTPRGTFVAFDARARVAEDEPAPVRTTVYAVDTSQSMSAGFARTRALVRALIRLSSLSGGRIALVSGDVRAQSCGGDALACLAALDTGGGSDLGALLDLALAEANRLGGPARVVLISDGVPSLGPRSSAELAERMREHAGTLEVAVHAIAAGPHPDVDFLTAVATAGGGRLHRGRDARALVGAIAIPLITEVTVDGDGLADLARIAGDGNLAPDDRVHAIGRLIGDRGTARIRGRYRGKPVAMSIAVDRGHARTSTMLERLWARHHIAARIAAGAERDDVVALSLRHSVMSPFTSFLVLETDHDYRRRGIARDASRRNARELGAIEGRRVATPGSRRGAGAAPQAARRAIVPQIRIANAYVTGDLDKRMIRRYLRQRFDRIRYCYTRALMRRPDLSGTVTLHFTIAPSGQITRAGIVESAVGHEAMERCVVDAVRSLRFPAVVGGGVVEVRYPFVFAPLEASGDAADNARREIAILEALGSGATVDDRARLLRLYLVAGDTTRADAHYRASARAIDPGGKHPERTLALFHTAAARGRYGADFRRAATRALARPNPPYELLMQAFDSYLADAPEGIPSAFGALAIDADDARAMLDSLAGAGHPGTAADLLGRWSRRDDLDEDWVIDAYLALERPRAVAARVARRCSALPAEWGDDPCAGWLRATAAEPAVRRMLARRLAALEARRARHRGDPEVVAAHAATLAALGRDREAARVASEIVELAPRDPDALDAYQRALEALAR